MTITVRFKKKAGKAPNKGPERIQRNTGPGMANDCKSRYKYTKANRVNAVLVCV